MFEETKTTQREKKNKKQENKCIYGSKSNLDCNCFCRDEIVWGAKLKVGKNHLAPLPLLCCMVSHRKTKGELFILATVPENTQGMRRKTG